MTLSLRARLTLWYPLALLVILLFFSVSVLWQQRRLGISRLDDELGVLLATTDRVLREELSEDPTLTPVSEETLTTVAVSGRLIAIVREDGSVVAARWADWPGRVLPAAAIERERGWTFAGAAGEWRLAARRGVFDGTPLALVAGVPLSGITRELAETRQAMIVGIPVVLLLAGGMGLWLATAGLRPITVMARRATQMTVVGDEDLGESERQDELGQLARAFNDLLRRLRHALAMQRQFMADASHELRTPVSVVRTAADVTLSRDTRDEAEYRDALEIVSGEGKRLGRLVDEMLLLARADAGAYPLRLVDLSISDVIDDCCRPLEVLAAQRQMKIRVDALDDMPFRGDEELLRQLMMNIMQNAVQHTGDGGTVHITADQDRQHLRVRVTDQGPGIPLDMRERIFERFVQLDPARRSRGTGLGLPIARWVATVHGGTLILESSSANGSTFCLTLPAGPSHANPLQTSPST